MKECLDYSMLNSSILFMDGISPIFIIVGVFLLSVGILMFGSSVGLYLMKRALRGILK